MRGGRYKRKSQAWQIIVLICLGICALISCSSGNTNQPGAPVKAGRIISAEEGGPVAEVPEAIYLEADREIFDRMLDSLALHRTDPIGTLVVRAGRLLVGSPYMAHTLERDEEVLVVNLRELDCTTYAENCLAIARTVRGEDPSFDRFLKELKTIRYRDGILEGYPSRLHYFCDWIHNNAEKGYVSECSSDLGGIPLRKNIDFMSTHPESYVQLEKDPSLVETIRGQEARINRHDMYYIPEERLESLEGGLEEGDIAGITTDIEGLAVMHVVILVPSEDGIHLMHASSAAGKVILSEETLSSYLQQHQRATGIMVARPL